MTDLADKLLSEGEGPSSPVVYFDSLGFATICRGVCVDHRVPGAGLPAAAITAANQASTDAARARAAALSGFERCNAVRQAVVVSLCFQLGTMDGWPDFKRCLAAGDFEGAADNILYADVATETPSKLLQQTPARCRREAEMMRTGVWVPQ